MGGFWGALFTVAGASETVAYLQAEAEANWIRTHQPEIWKNTYKYLFLSGYLTYLLTGRFVDSVGCQVGYIPFDYKTQAWAAKRTGNGRPYRWTRTSCRTWYPRADRWVRSAAKPPRRPASRQAAADCRCGR